MSGIRCALRGTVGNTQGIVLIPVMCHETWVGQGSSLLAPGEISGRTKPFSLFSAARLRAELVSLGHVGFRLGNKAGDSRSVRRHGLLVMGQLRTCRGEGGLFGRFAGKSAGWNVGESVRFLRLEVTPVSLQRGRILLEGGDIVLFAREIALVAAPVSRQLFAVSGWLATPLSYPLPPLPPSFSPLPPVSSALEEIQLPTFYP